MSTFQHVSMTVIKFQEDGVWVEYRHSRYSDDLSPQEAWEKLRTDVKETFGPKAVLVSAVMDDDHQHLPALIGGKMVFGEHMP